MDAASLAKTHDFRGELSTFPDQYSHIEMPADEKRRRTFSS